MDFFHTFWSQDKFIMLWYGSDTSDRFGGNSNISISVCTSSVSRLNSNSVHRSVSVNVMVLWLLFCLLTSVTLLIGGWAIVHVPDLTQPDLAIKLGAN